MSDSHADGGGAATTSNNLEPDVITSATEADREPLESVNIDLTEKDLKDGGVEKSDVAEETVQGGEAGDDPEIDTASTTGKHQKNRIPARQQIGRLTAQRNQERDARVAADEENARLRAEMTRLRGAATVVDKSAMDNYKSAATAEFELAKRDVATAETEADPNKKADAAAKLALAAAKVSGIQEYERANPAPKTADRQPPQQREQQTQQREQPRVDPKVASWISDNPWFDAQSDDYDEDMQQDTVLLARRIERRYAAENRQGEINSPKYFAELDAAVREQFPDRFDDQPPARRQTPPMNRGRDGAPVSRNGADMTNGRQQNGAMRVNLNSEERDMAHRMAAAGATLNPDGSRLTPVQAERRFALQKLKDQAAQRQNPRR